MVPISIGLQNEMGHPELDFRAIPRLYGSQNYWQWRVLLKSYLEANDLWKHNEPKEVVSQPVDGIPI